MQSEKHWRAYETRNVPNLAGCRRGPTAPWFVLAADPMACGLKGETMLRRVINITRAGLALMLIALADVLLPKPE